MSGLLELAKYSDGLSERSLVPGPLQTVTGLQGRVETAKHDMKNIFEDDETEAVILADASNSFNLLKRMFSLHNVQVFCTKFSHTH